MRTLPKVTIILFIVLTNIPLKAQKKLAEFPFEIHDRAINVSTAIGVSTIKTQIASSDVLVQTPTVIPDGNINSLFFQFKAGYSVSTNNINFAIAPKQGSNVRITHIEFRIRFGSSNNGNAGIFISKDPTFTINTQLWTCGNNKTFNTYKNFVVVIPESELSYSESTTDSIRFVIGQGTNTLGMYIDDIMIYGIVNNETNPVQTISVDASNTTKNLVTHPSGANLCWLMDSDIKWPRTISNEDRFAEMKLGSLRFPYGHLADNYLWHTPGQYSTVESTGPIPQVASPDTPSSWTWAVNQTNGTFLKDLSFDEYIAICKRKGIEPLIVINAQSYKYTGGPTYETLKTSAKEWVRYANITKGYGVKYWQIGNEVEHDGNLSMAEYTNLFIDFATEMKSIDPTIKVGTGVLANTTWNKDVLTKAGTLCSFISTHNYQFNSTVAAGGFRTWYKDNSILATNTSASQSMLNSNFSDRTDIEILVTETNVTGGDFPDLSLIDIYKALYWFEMDMNQLAQKNVTYTYCWGTHSPWSGETNPGDLGSILENSSDNTIRPSGKIIQLVNTYLKDKLINVNRVTGNLRVYASVSNMGNELSVFILNKNLYAEKTTINVSGFNTDNSDIEQVVFKGTSFNDIAPTVSSSTLAIAPNLVELPGTSLTIIHYVNNDNTSLLNTKTGNYELSYFKDNLHIQSFNDSGKELKVCSTDGKIVFQKRITGESVYVNLSFLNNGVYMASVSDSNTLKVVKIIK